MPSRSGRHGGIAGGVVAGNLITDTIRGVVRTVAKPLITFANEETARKQLSLTAGVSEEQVDKDFQDYRKVAPDLGTTPKKMLEVVNGYVAAGLSYTAALKAAVPTVKTAKAGSADIDDVTQAGIAAMENLKISPDNIQSAFDTMLASGKSGQVELKDLAKVLPEAAASAQKAGYSNLPGLTQLTSELQFARKSTSTASEAATNAKNYFDKVFAPVTIKAFKEAGIDIVKEIKKGEKAGKSAADVTFEQAMKYSNGDPFKLKELFGDVQAGDFLMTKVKYAQDIKDNMAEVTKTAPGSVENDFRVMMDRLAGSAEKLNAAFERLTGRLGEMGRDAAKQSADEVKGMLDTSDEILGRIRANSLPAENAVQDMEARLLKLNEDVGLTAREKFNRRFGDTSMSGQVGAFGNLRDRLRWGKAGIGMTAPSFGSVGDRLNWTKAGAERATQTVTNNTNTGNDQRTQSAHVTVNATGLDAVGQAVLAKVQSGLSTMGPSITKGNLTSTGATTSP